MKNYIYKNSFYLKNTNTFAFTMVEIITVITILAILSTISFFGYSEHIIGARDASRISQITEIRDGLETFRMNNPLPDPEDAIEIFGSGILLGYQGYMGKSNLGLIGYNNGGIDPKDQTFYTYFLSSDRRSFQLMTYLESSKDIQIFSNADFFNKANANDFDYSKRYLNFSGERLGILTECDTNKLLQEIPELKSTGQFEVSTATGSFRVSFAGNDSKCGTGELLYAMLKNRTTNPFLQCAENIGYRYNSHTYNIPESNVGDTLNNIVSDPVSGLNGLYEYTLTSVTCSNSGTYINPVESAISYAVSCNTGYSISEESTLCEENSCANAPSYTYSTFTKGNPSEAKQGWQNYDNSSPCYYTCPAGYTGNDCDTPLSQYYACSSAGQILTASSRYSGCDVNDIIVCAGNGLGYTIAACNVGSSKSGTGSESYGKYFQWGRNKGFVFGDISSYLSLIDGVLGLNEVADLYGFIESSPLYDPYTWAVGDITDNRGDETDSNGARRGPCATGYHIPRKTEWLAVVLAGGWSTNGNGMVNALKLPLAGYRGGDNGNMKSQGNFAGYWASNGKNKKSSQLEVFLDFINPYEDNVRIHGFTVRCVKN
ncbi:MAG: hypothetical protein PHN31_00515 [Candidatus Gracilibacteria bacterium]|nr:hypothetical protein [Candidatus Gracilibacteria bacterium]